MRITTRNQPYLPVQDDRLAGSEKHVLDAARAAGVSSFAVKSTSEADWSKVRV